MTQYIKNVFLVFSTLIAISVSAQTGFYLDPGQAYVKLLLENGSTTVQRIGTYKVNGTSYLFGEKHTATIFEHGEKRDLFLSYNTFNQQLECYSSVSQSAPLVKDLEMVDSFILHKGNIAPFAEDLYFINGTLLSAPDKGFYLVVERGKQFSLYKKYKSTLGIVSTNYVQSDLRQFDLEYIYYYTDSTSRKMKKLKSNPYNVKKEFNSIKDISALVDDASFAQNPESCLKSVVKSLNTNPQ